MIDSNEVMRPPVIDLLLVFVASLGAIIVVVQPVADPATFSRGVLDPTMLALVLFLAVRSAAGIASLTESGLMSLYLSYPLPRAGVFLSILASRVVAPSALILLVPLVTSLIVLKFSLLDEISWIALFYLAFLTQALFYGSLFSLIAVTTRSQALSGVGGVVVYFIVIVMNTILPIIGRIREVELLEKIGHSLSLQDLVYYEYRGTREIEVWQFALIPSLAVLAILIALIYFTRRFEPR
ncbi:MAG: hypothetical protein QXS85_04535 [Acidilobaceae archaeon]